MKNKEKIEERNYGLYICSILLGLGMKTFQFDDTILGIGIDNLLISLGSTMFLIDTIENINPYRNILEGAKLEVNGKIPRFIKKKETEYGYDLIFSLPAGLSLKQFEQKKTELENYFGGQIEFTVENRKIRLKIYKNQLQSYYEYKHISTKGICEFPIGYTHGNQLVTVDLQKVVHLLIAGETGSGKSTLLRVIITNIILDKNPKLVSLYLIDLKSGAEFNIFRKCQMVKSFSRTIEEAEETLNKLIAEVDRRYDLFYKYNVVDIKEYNKLKGVKKLDYKIVVIDEFADLQKQKDSISAVEILATKARACGIHLIIATQRPDAQIINGRIKANIPAVIGFKTLNNTNSRIIIDENGLEELKGKGHGIFKFDEMIEFQGMFLTPTQARELIKHTYVEEVKEESQKSEEKAGQVEDFGFLKMLIGGKKWLLQIEIKQF